MEEDEEQPANSAEEAGRRTKSSWANNTDGEFVLVSFSYFT